MLLVVLAAVLLMPTALALDQEEILQDQSQSLGIEDLEEAGEAYTGQHDIEDGLDVGASFRHMAETGKEALGGVVKRSVRSCVLLLAVTLLIPLCYAFVAANVAWAALGNDGLKRIGGLLKWLITILLSVVLLAFVGYLNLSGVISGGADAATVKAAKFTISNMVPVVGGVISDTAETLLAGASVLRNAAGVFGMLAVIGICVVPFLNLGVHYLMYKCTAALAATVSADGRITGLIEALGTAFGLILAMTASCAVLLVVAMVSTVSAVVG